MDQMKMLREELARCCPALELREQEPMSRHTSFHIGGPAALMALPKSREEAACAVRTAAGLGIAPFFMGNGSNLLVPDEGVDRFLIKSVPGLERCQVQGTQLLAGAGISLARLAAFARDEGLTGLEFAHGIPGSVGGAVCMNAGAYGGEMSQVVSSAAVLFPDEGIRTLTGEALGFSYRHSLLTDCPDGVVLSAVFRLQPGDPAAIKAKMDELMTRRKTSQPFEYPSAGSTFKRPEGHYAAALIDQCGLKGLTVGGAQVSEKHAGFVINTGRATCDDVTDLMAEIQTRVFNATGVRLDPEVKIVEP